MARDIVTRKEFYEEARKWVGTPWKHQGRTVKGIDCGGLLILTAKGLGLPYEDTMDYGREPTPNSLMSHLSKMLTLRRKKRIIPGTIGIFREGRYPCHISIFSEKYNTLHVIHALVKRRGTVEDPYVPQTGGLQLVGVYDFNGVGRNEE